MGILEYSMVSRQLRRILLVPTTFFFVSSHKSSSIILMFSFSEGETHPESQRNAFPNQHKHRDVNIAPSKYKGKYEVYECYRKIASMPEASSCHGYLQEMYITY